MEFIFYRYFFFRRVVIEQTKTNKDSDTKVFFCRFCEIFQISFFAETFGVTVSEILLCYCVNKQKYPQSKN